MASPAFEVPLGTAGFEVCSDGMCVWEERTSLSVCVCVRVSVLCLLKVLKHNT